MSDARASMPSWSTESGDGPSRWCGVGRHTAADGAGADPLVAAALAQRSDGGGGAHHGDAASSSGEGGLGWPVAPEAPEPGDGGLGWPGGGSGQDAEDATATETPAALPRRGWRRLFGSAPAA